MCDFRLACGGVPLTDCQKKQFTDAFCNQDYPRCARYIISKIRGLSHVPEDLLPGDRSRVTELLPGLI